MTIPHAWELPFWQRIRVYLAKEVVAYENERTHRVALVDVDKALAGYGVAFSKTAMPDADREQAFEEARLALRRVRDLLAGVSA
jgi:hypothetical protein